MVIKWPWNWFMFLSSVDPTNTQRSNFHWPADNRYNFALPGLRQDRR